MTEALPLRITDAAHPSLSHKPETPEGVAFGLMELIFFNELVKPTREEILETYSICLRTVKSAASQPSIQPQMERSKRRSTAPMQDELAESRP